MQIEIYIDGANVMTCQKSVEVYILIKHIVTIITVEGIETAQHT